MMYHALRGFGDATTDPYAGTDALGPATTSNPPLNASDLAGATATPDCDPHSQVCHWYCYIPFMMTPDCIASFDAGTQGIANAAGQTVGGAVSSTVTGAASGFAQGLLNPGSSSSSSGTMSMSTGLMFAVVGGIAALVLLTGKK